MPCTSDQHHKNTDYSQKTNRTFQIAMLSCEDLYNSYREENRATQTDQTDDEAKRFHNRPVTYQEQLAEYYLCMEIYF